MEKFKVKKKKLGSYPYFSVIASITLSLFIIGLFGALVIYSKELERIVKENVKVQVYLKNQLSDNQRIQIEKTIASKAYVIQSAEAIQFISRDEAAKEFIKETGEDFKNFLGENPLRDAYLVRIKEEFQNKDGLKKIKNELEKTGGVYEVYYVENVIEAIHANITKIGFVLIGLASVLLTIVVLLINNTLRLALFSQRLLIRSMQLVGARKSFIQKPFLSRAGWLGFISGIIALLALYGTLQYAHYKVSDLELIRNDQRLIILGAALLGIGVLIAVLSTFNAVNKYLKLSLDELY